MNQSGKPVMHDASTIQPHPRTRWFKRPRGTSSNSNQPSLDYSLPLPPLITSPPHHSPPRHLATPTSPLLLSLSCRRGTYQYTTLPETLRLCVLFPFISAVDRLQSHVGVVAVSTLPHRLACILSVPILSRAKTLPRVPTLVLIAVCCGGAGTYHSRATNVLDAVAPAPTAVCCGGILPNLRARRRMGEEIEGGTH